MAQRTGESGSPLDSARSALARHDARLADADRILTDALAGAWRCAAESVRRIDAARTAVDAAAHGHPADSPAGARELSRLLLVHQREVIRVVTDATAVAAAETVVLRGLAPQYRPAP